MASTNQPSTPSTALTWLRSSAASIAADPSSPYYNPHHPSETSSLLAFQRWEREHETWEAEDRERIRQELEPGRRAMRRMQWALVVLGGVVL
ncbi:MAG: hypothetical protein Q9195_003647, partial [Heterodermia aff. obscurata]